jgi:thiamine monophosphate synthase
MAMRPNVLTGIAAVISALVLVFALGGLSGYLAARVTQASTGQVAVVNHIAPCPPATHAVVWYTARTWGCLYDAGTK